MTSQQQPLLLVGLGNAGEEYEKTRHNAGFLFLDFLADAKESFEKDKYTHSAVYKRDNLILAKPNTMMNASGKAVAALLAKEHIPPADLYIIHDDLDLQLGQYKIQKSVGPKLHNGITSIEQSLGTSDFWRIRIGVDNRNPVSRAAGESYVLERFLDSELTTLNEVFTKIANEKNFLTP